MADGVRLEGSDDFGRYAAAMRGGGRELQAELRKALEKAARETSEVTVRQGSAEMPAGGGLRARLAAARGSAVVKLRGNDVEATVSIRNREDDAVGLIDRGFVAHKVFGEWRGAALQRVPAHAFSNAAKKQDRRNVDDVRQAVQAALRTITRKA